MAMQWSGVTPRLVHHVEVDLGMGLGVRQEERRLDHLDLVARASSRSRTVSMNSGADDEATPSRKPARVQLLRPPRRSPRSGRRVLGEQRRRPSRWPRRRPASSVSGRRSSPNSSASARVRDRVGDPAALVVPQVVVAQVGARAVPSCVGDQLDGGPEPLAPVAARSPRARRRGRRSTADAVTRAASVAGFRAGRARGRTSLMRLDDSGRNAPRPGRTRRRRSARAKRRGTTSRA